MYTCHVRYVSRPEPPIEPSKTAGMSVVVPQGSMDHILGTTGPVNYIGLNSILILYTFIDRFYLFIYLNRVIFTLNIYSV